MTKIATSRLAFANPAPSMIKIDAGQYRFAAYRSWGNVMIGYVTLGTNDIERTRGFYDALLGEIGATRIHSTDHITIWGAGLR